MLEAGRGDGYDGRGLALPRVVPEGGGGLRVKVEHGRALSFRLGGNGQGRGDGGFSNAAFLANGRLAPVCGLLCGG